MLSLVLGLLINSASSMIVENHCTSYSVNATSITKLEVNTTECVAKYFDSKSEVNFLAEGDSKNKLILLSQRNEKIDFCTIPADIISEINIKTGKKKELWNSSKNFMSVLQSTTFEEAIVRNAAASKKNNFNTCYAFPSFYRIKKFGKNLFPKSFKELNDGGYIFLSSRAKTIFLFDLKLNKIIYTFETPQKSHVKDAVFTSNGDLYVLYEQLTQNDVMNDVCLQKWDVGSGTIMNNVCNIKNIKDQILIYENDKIFHLYTQSGTMVLETIGSKPVVVAKTGGIGEFKLMNSILRDEDKKSITTEKHAPLK